MAGRYVMAVMNGLMTGATLEGEGEFRLMQYKFFKSVPMDQLNPSDKSLIVVDVNRRTTYY